MQSIRNTRTAVSVTVNINKKQSTRCVMQYPTATQQSASIITKNTSTWYTRKGSFLSESVFPNFPKFGNNRRYVSIYGGVLSRFVKFSRTKNYINKFVNIPIFGKKQEIWKSEKLREKNVEIWKKDLR